MHKESVRSAFQKILDSITGVKKTVKGIRAFYRMKKNMFLPIRNGIDELQSRLGYSSGIRSRRMVGPLRSSTRWWWWLVRERSRQSQEAGATLGMRAARHTNNPGYSLLWTYENSLERRQWVRRRLQRRSQRRKGRKPPWKRRNG